MIVTGLVCCHTCTNNSLPTSSCFIPDAMVRVDCKFKAASPRTQEETTVSVNKTTSRFGVYKVNIPSADAMVCAEAAIAASCQASLVQSSSPWCHVPGNKSMTNENIFKSKQPNVCIYSLKPLSFRPSNRNIAFYGK